MCAPNNKNKLATFKYTHKKIIRKMNNNRIYLRKTIKTFFLNLINEMKTVFTSIAHSVYTILISFYIFAFCHIYSIKFFCWIPIFTISYSWIKFETEERSLSCNSNAIVSLSISKYFRIKLQTKLLDMDFG